MTDKTSTAWQFADKNNMTRTLILRLLHKIGAKPVGRGIRVGVGRPSDVYLLADLERAAKLQQRKIDPPPGVAAITVPDFAKLCGTTTTTVNRHIKNNGLKPVGMVGLTRRFARLYALDAMHELAKGFNYEAGWSPAHEKIVRKRPVAATSKRCKACSEVKPLHNFKRNGSAVIEGLGHHSTCNACRAAGAPAPVEKGLDNDLCRAFLRGAI